MILDSAEGRVPEGVMCLVRFPALIWNYLCFCTEVLSVLIYALFDFWFTILNTCLLSSCSRPESSKSLANEVILVTGGGSGIGRELCLQLAVRDNRATIISWDVNEAGNLETYNELVSLGVQSAHAFSVDVSNEKQVAAAARKIRQEIGDVTILFNNAGIACSSVYGWEGDSRVFRKCVEVNTLGHCWTLREFLPSMIQNKKGHIIETCSVLGWLPGPLGAPYTMSKFAIRGFMECIKEDLRKAGHAGITISTAYPPFTRTNMTAGFTLQAAKYPFLMDHFTPSYVASLMISGMFNKDEYIYMPLRMRLLHLLVNVVSPNVLRKLGDIAAVNIVPDSPAGSNG